VGRPGDLPERISGDEVIVSMIKGDIKRILNRQTITGSAGRDNQFGPEEWNSCRCGNNKDQSGMWFRDFLLRNRDLIHFFLQAEARLNLRRGIP
jgi:hypothetical protein